MARRPVLTSRQRSALFSLPPREADLRRHDTLSDNSDSWSCEFPFVMLWRLTGGAARGGSRLINKGERA